MKKTIEVDTVAMNAFGKSLCFTGVHFCTLVE